MKTKKILTSLLVGVVAGAALTVSSMACENPDTTPWDGETYCTEWLSSGEADGQEGDVFYLNSAADLAGLSKVLYEWYPGNTNNPFQGDTFYLNVDVDLNNKEWIPIGTALNSKGVEKGKWFGSFDGQGHTISNLKITGEFQHAGLFGYTGGATQTVENITLENVTIYNNVTKKPATGALVGRINSNTFVISDVDVTGTVDIEGIQFTGGIAGYGRGQIVDCDVTATGTIHNSLNDVGGIVGVYYATSNDTYVKDCTVNGGKDGLVVSTDYGMIGGAIGFVSADAAVTESVVDNVIVENVTVRDASGESAAYIAYGYTATNSTAAKVEVVDGEGTEIVPEDAAQTKAVASVNGEYFTDLAAAFKSVSEDATIEILSDITIDTAWQCNFGRGISSGTFNNNEVTINGNDHVIKFTGKMTDGNTEAVISTAAPITVNDLTFDLSECPSYRRVISARTSAVINNCTFIGNPANTKTSYAVIVGESGTDLANTTLTVTESEFNDFSYGVSDNRNGQDIKSVTVTDSEFTNAKVLLSASESITFNENVMDNGSVNITSYSEDIKLAVEMKNNTLDATADNKIQKCAELDTDETEGIILPTITVGDIKYSTFAMALAAANEGDTIYVAPGRYTEALTVAKNIVITGDPDYGTSGAALASDIEKPVIVISEVADGGVKYQATDVTFDNIVFEVAEDATRTGGYYACALGYFVEDNMTRNTLTVTNCDFINNSSVPGMIAIMAHIPNYTVTGCTFTNFSTGIYTALDNSEMGNVVVSDNTFANVAELYSGYWGKENAAASLVIDNNKASDDSTTVINVYDYVKETVGTAATSYGSTFAVTNNDAKVILTNATKDIAEKATGNDEVVYTYKSEDLMRSLDENLPEGTVYVAYGSENQEMFITVDGKVKTEVETVSLVFRANTDDEYKDELENAVWDMYLVASDSEIINRLNSADFTFELTTDEEKDAMAYEIIATNDEIVINNVNNDDNRYEFHYNGKDDTTTDTALEIKIGTVKFTGYGSFVFAVDTTDVAENTNQVHTTTFVDNLVDSFVVGGVVDADGNVTNELDVEAYIGSEIIVPTQKLTINVDFPNTISDNTSAYQQMKVTVSGGDLEQALTVDLGTDPVISDYTAETYDNKKDVAVTVSDLYKIEIVNLLTINNTYTVTVEGAGYRTARYNVTMTQDKTLNFWNNVKDKAFNIEENKDSSAKTVTFLAGDIVKDSTINIYDLSAVVSYFGEIDLNKSGEYNEYAKYDLNRDGKIDSKDVAYVLVSWGK